MLHSININRFGSAQKGLLRNQLLSPLLSSTSAYATTNEKSSFNESLNRAPFQVEAAVDPAILPACQGDILSSLLWRRQKLGSRRSSSLSENAFLRTPKPPSSFDAPRKRHGNGVSRLNTSKRKCRCNLPHLKKSIDRRRRESLMKNREEGKNKSANKKWSRDRRDFSSDDLIDEVSSAYGDTLSKSVAIEGGLAHQLVQAQKIHKDLHTVPRKKKRKKKKGPILPPKFKANLHDFKQRIEIEGTGYVMEMYLDPKLIEDTRKNNIDTTKQPKIEVRFSRAADMRDEYSSYCGQRKSLRNWLYYV